MHCRCMGCTEGAWICFCAWGRPVAAAKITSPVALSCSWVNGHLSVFSWVSVWALFGSVGLGVSLQYHTS